jgi:hypothetical protein
MAVAVDMQLAELMPAEGAAVTQAERPAAMPVERLVVIAAERLAATAAALPVVDSAAAEPAVAADLPAAAVVAAVAAVAAVTGNAEAFRRTPDLIILRSSSERLVCFGGRAFLIWTLKNRI